VRHLPRAARAQHVEEAVLRERGRLDAADAHQSVPVDRRHACALADRDVERGEIRVADERLRIVADEIEVEVRDGLCGAESTLQRLDDVDLRVGEEHVQVLPSPPSVTGDVVVAVPDAVGELHAIAARLPPLDTAQDVGAAVVRAGSRGHADRPAVRKRPAEPCRRDHLQIRTVCLASASRPRTSETTAVRVCAPLRFPRVRHVVS
jgi:hypothetical protein